MKVTVCDIRKMIEENETRLSQDPIKKYRFSQNHQEAIDLALQQTARIMTSELEFTNVAKEDQFTFMDLTFPKSILPGELAEILLQQNRVADAILAMLDYAKNNPEVFLDDSGVYPLMHLTLKTLGLLVIDDQQIIEKFVKRSLIAPPKVKKDFSAEKLALLKDK